MWSNFIKFDQFYLIKISGVLTSLLWLYLHSSPQRSVLAHLKQHPHSYRLKSWLLHSFFFLVCFFGTAHKCISRQQGKMDLEDDILHLPTWIHPPHNVKSLAHLQDLLNTWGWRKWGVEEGGGGTGVEHIWGQPIGVTKGQEVYRSQNDLRLQRVKGECVKRSEVELICMKGWRAFWWRDARGGGAPIVMWGCVSY